MNDAPSSSAIHLQALRASLAHVLANAVTQLRPGTSLGASAVTDDGFYCDFALTEALHPNDFASIEERMREILSACEAFVTEDLALLDSMQEPFLRAHLEAQSPGTLTLQRMGSFASLSAGPLLSSAREIPSDCFALRSLAGAYFQGDAAKLMMTRVYAFAQPSQAALAAAIAEYERAALRDHKKLGRELELFMFDDEIGPGLPLWLPNGTAIRDELEKLMKELEFEAGFERVVTPQIARQALYYRTGHLPYYADSMFPLMQSEHDPEAVFALRPMNCPHHHKVFAARKRSYRELPFRISEYGNVYRYEDSGAVSGLLRTRSMCMNDAHIYCTPDQVVTELRAVLSMHERVYRVLDLKNFRVRLSTRGALHEHRDKFVDDAAGFQHAEDILRRVLIESGIEFFEGPGEAAFYGPKIDFQFRMVTGREETASTLQLDFASAARLDLAYTSSNGEPCRPFIIHRAPLGTHERFVALLIERFAGAFPTWLAPVQARVLPVGDSSEDYALEVRKSLRATSVRADLQVADESLGKRIRQAALQKIPYVLVVGDRERDQRSVSLRRHGSERQESLPLAELESRIACAIVARSLSD